MKDNAKWVMPINMPKTYDCPKCGAKSRREAIIGTGAIYKCRTHGRFLVPVNKSQRERANARIAAIQSKQRNSGKPEQAPGNA